MAWRRHMGIEPTNHLLSDSTGFEDQARHQTRSASRLIRDYSIGSFYYYFFTIFNKSYKTVVVGGVPNFGQTGLLVYPDRFIRLKNAWIQL